jgi:hypothetical protein
MSDLEMTEEERTSYWQGAYDRMAGRNKELHSALGAKDKLIGELVGALDAALGFVAANVADPDTTQEMWNHYRKLKDLKPEYLLLRAKEQE